MRKLGKLTAGALVLAGTAWAAQQGFERRSSFVDETVGYALEVPRFPGVVGQKTGMRLSVMGPVEDGAVSNINVTVLAQATTPDAYLARTIAEMKPLGLKVNSQRFRQVSGRVALEMDYEGVIGKTRPLRYLSLGIIEPNRVVLLTCSAAPEKFPAVEPEFRACLDSFRLK